MRRFEIFILTSLLHLVLFGIYFSRTNPTFFAEVYTVEDGLIEWVTAGALLSTALLCFYRAATLRGARPQLFIACTALAGAVFVFGMGEEISWGQRLFGVQTPEFFAKHNAQNETNLHNLVAGGVKINKLIFGAGLAVAVVSYLLILPILYAKNDRIRALADRFAVPVAQTHHLLCYGALFALTALVTAKRKGELLEVGGTLLFFLIFLYPRNGHIFTPVTIPCQPRRSDL